MAQWMNLHQNNSFANRMRLSMFCEISGAVHLALVGLTAGRLADKIQVNSKTLEFATDRDFDFSFCLTRVQHNCSSTNAFQ